MKYVYYIFYVFLFIIFKPFGKNKFYKFIKQQRRKFITEIEYRSLPKKFVYEMEYLKAYITFKQKYDVTLPVDVCGAGDIFVMDKIKVGDIRHRLHDKVYYLDEPYPNSPYQILLNKNNCSGGGEDEYEYKRTLQTLNSLKKHGYQPSKMCVCVTKDNVVLDGQHRSCCVLYLYGKDYEIDVCRIYKSHKIKRRQRKIPEKSLIK